MPLGPVDERQPHDAMRAAAITNIMRLAAWLRENAYMLQHDRLPDNWMRAINAKERELAERDRIRSQL